MDAAKKSHEKINNKSGESAKEIGVSMESRPSLEERATNLFAKNLETMIAGDNLVRIPQVRMEATASPPPLLLRPQIRSGSECFPLQSDTAALPRSGSNGTSGWIVKRGCGQAVSSEQDSIAAQKSCKPYKG